MKKRYSEEQIIGFLKEAVAVIPEQAIAGDHLVRLLDEVCAIRGRPSIIRSDNGKEFTGRAMLTWAHRHGIALRLMVIPPKATCRVLTIMLADEW